MPPRFCFGYGSLVNRDTHRFDVEGSMDLVGWRRIWNHRVSSERYKVTSLSISPSPGSTIKGLVLKVLPDEQPELDRREAGYELTPLDHPEEANMQSRIRTYVSKNQASGGAEFPILQSYLDTVLLGFYAEYGTDGISHLLNTTDGWEAPILKDRSDPIYPRACRPSRNMMVEFDDALKGIGATWLDQA